MGITISGENNNDRILATDGVIDQLSGFNVVGVMTATSFTGNLTGDVTGNLTGNVNHTSNLLLQIGGSEKFRVGPQGQLGIGGANYGTSGQVLQSAGSGAPPTWNTINSDKIAEGNTEAEVVDTGSDGHFKVTTEGNERLRINSSGEIISTNGTLRRNVDNSSFTLSGGTASNSGSNIGVYGNNHDSLANVIRFRTGSTERLRITSNGDLIIGSGGSWSYPKALNVQGQSGSIISLYNADTTSYAADTNTSIEFKLLTGNTGNQTGACEIRAFKENGTNGNNARALSFYTGANGGGNAEKVRIGSAGQIGLGGANYGEARQTIVSGGASAAVSWSSNPFLLDMVGLGDIDYDAIFLRYRETGNVTGNGLVHLGLCKSTTNCSPGRIGIPVGFIPGTSYNSHFRVDKVGITPWPDSSGHRYEFYAIISDFVGAGKLGVFYLTNSTN